MGLMLAASGDAGLTAVSRRRLRFCVRSRWASTTAIVLPPLIATFWVTLTTLAFAIPLGLMTAVYISEVAHPRVRLIIKSAPVLHVLQITGADRLLTIYPHLLAALADPLTEAQEAPGGG